MEHDDVIDAVKELRSEVSLKFVIDLSLHSIVGSDGVIAISET